MRTSLVLSLILHALVLAAALVGFRAHERKPDMTRPVTVEMAPASEVSAAKAGKLEAKPEEAAKQTPPVQKQDNIVQTSAELRPSLADKISQKLAALPPPKPKAPPPEEAKEKPKPEAHAESADKPAKEEKTASTPAKHNAASKPQPAQRKEPPRTAQEAEHHAKPKPKPVRREDHIAELIDRPTPTQGESKFDPKQIAALLNRDPTAGAPPEEDAPRRPWRKPSSLEEQAMGMAPEARQRQAYGEPAGRDARMSANEIDAFRAQISRCWTPPIGGLGGAPLIVRLHIMLNEDGTLAQAPEVANSDYSPFFRPAADAAMRAVMQCQPYRMPPEKYSQWRDMLLNFDPSQMYGG